MALESTSLDPCAIAEALHRCLHALDRVEHDSSGDRLAVVADLMAGEIGLMGWSTFCDGQGPGLRLAARHLLRPGAVPGDLLDGRIEELVEGWGICASRTSGPPFLRARALRSELTEILIVGGYAPDAGRWVLECYSDHDAPPLVGLLPAMYAVVQAALGFPQAPLGLHRRAPDLVPAVERGSRQLALVGPRTRGA